MSTSSPGWRQALRLAWIPVAVWIASIGVAEVAYRLAGVHVAGKMDGFYEAFGDRGFKLRPGADAFMNWYSGSFSVHTDDQGLRVGAHPLPEAQVRSAEILVLGDSQAFGQGLEFEDSLVGVFAATARADGLTAVNAAVAGHWLRNQVELARWLVQERGLRPKTVLVCLSPRTLSDGDGYLHVFVRAGKTFDERPGYPQLARYWLSTHAATWIVLRNAFRQEDVSESAASVLQLYATAPHEERLRKLVAVMQDLQRAVEPSGARVALAYLPLAAELQFDGLVRKAGARLRDPVSAHEPLRLAHDLAGALKAPLVDLTPSLQRELAAGHPLVLRGDPHYSRAVSRTAGEALYSGVDWRALVKGTLAYVQH